MVRTRTFQTSTVSITPATLPNARGLVAWTVIAWLGIIAALTCGQPAVASADEARPPVSRESVDGQLTRGEWAAFEARFVMPDGRVVDRENDHQSHSEGQGYGMLLAVEADRPRDFARIWTFARRNLQIRRSDTLLSWRWQPRAYPRVSDKNNATDGDILVAYALLRAAAAWDRRDYVRAADAIIDDIGRKLVRRVDGRPVLIPAAFGFERTPETAAPSSTRPTTSIRRSISLLSCDRSIPGTPLRAPAWS